MEGVAATVRDVDDDTVRLIGAAIYWCEGKKAKPWRPLGRVVFVNSDPGLVAIFLRFLQVMGVGLDRVTFRVYIHETADAAASETWWARQLGVTGDRFKRTVLKRHHPGTPRRNTGAEYHGCLAVEVFRSNELYWQIAGIMEGLAAATDPAAADRPAAGPAQEHGGSEG